MRLLRAADRKAAPWKNGGGVTREIAASPGADGFDFDWRLSIAEVNAGGPFSTFPGVDRSLVVLEGRMLLKVGDCPGIEMVPEAEPLIFPGDGPTAAELLEPVIDLNLMTRRAGFWGRLTRLTGREHLQLRCGVAVLVALGDIQVLGEALSRFDAVLIDGETDLAPAGGLCWLAEIFAL